MQTLPQPFTSPSATQEADLVTAWQERKDSSALTQLIHQNLPRIRAWARKNGQGAYEDLITEGVIALIEAADRYPKDHPIPFSTHASPAMRGAVIRARTGLYTQVSIPERKLRDAFAGRLPAAQAETILAATDTAAIEDVAENLKVGASEEEVIGRETQRGFRAALAGALRSLTREERVLVVRHLLKEDQALEDVAAHLGISIPKARSLESRALMKMRNTLIKNGFLVTDFR